MKISNFQSTEAMMDCIKDLVHRGLGFTVNYDREEITLDGGF